jgi:hypothetical protein
MPARRDLSAGGEGRRLKASEEGTRGPVGAVCHLGGFDRAAVSAKGGLGGVVKGGLPLTQDFAGDDLPTSTDVSQFPRPYIRE